MSKIKLIVCDLDGTLLDENKEITKFSVHVLKLVKEQGIKVCFASGRDHQMMSIYEAAIQGCDFLLSSNGAVVCDSQEHVLFHAYIPNKEVVEILNFLYEKEMVCMLYTIDCMYYVDGCKKLMQRIIAHDELAKKHGICKKLKSKPMNMEDEFSTFHTVTKIVVYEDDQDKIDMVKDFVERTSEISCEATGYGLLGIFSKSVSKYKGIETIKKEMNITKDEVVIFGDFDNDISMFACADMSVAMENASNHVKASAKYQCASNQEDGVAKFILENIL